MPQGKSKVNFFLSEIPLFYLTNRKALKNYITSIFRQENKDLESIIYVFTNDKRILSINKKYLNHSFLTDIITFDLSEKQLPTVGEVYISIQRVKENAVIHKTSFKEEIHRVIFHGVLHLCGYNDKTNKQLDLMRKKENLYLDKYFKYVSRDTL